MSASTASLNVLRWSALGLGAVYGLYHQQSLNSAAAVHSAEKQFAARESLIAQAKREFQQKKAGLTPGAGAQDESVTGGLDNPKFDLEKWFATV